MRPLCCFILLIFFSSVSVLAQDTVAKVLRVDRLSAEGVLLDKGWKFLPGDNPAYANSEYDDGAWETINPALDIYDLPQIPKSGIVWFRLRLSINTSLDRQLALIIQQSGASEIYLDGQLIHRFGVLSSNSADVKAYDPGVETRIISYKGKYRTGFSSPIRPPTPYPVYYHICNK